MKSLLDVLNLAADYLRSKGVMRPRFCAEDLLAHHLKMKRLDLYMQFDRPLLEEELKPYRQDLKRAAQHEPLPYILGEVSFYGVSLRIDRRVLIPRQETELLAERVAQRIKKRGGEKIILWDICTGSGCLGLSLKKQFPYLDVVLSDLSCEALEVACENGRRLGLDVEYVQGDLLTPFQGKKADVIVCNPPYIAHSEWNLLDRSVTLYEPRMALEAGGDQGQEFYSRLSLSLSSHLRPQGICFFEIGKDQGDLVRDLFTQNGYSVVVEKDYAGHDRFVYLNCEERCLEV